MVQTLQILATKFSQLLLESYSTHKKDRRVEVTPLACSQQVTEPGFGTQQSESSALILLCATLLYTIRLQISIGVIFPIKTLSSSKLLYKKDCCQPYTLLIKPIVTLKVSANLVKFLCNRISN